MDLIGRRFGKLVVSENDVTRKGYVLCQCDCGKIKSIRATSLTKKKQPTRSCGCIQREYAQNIASKSISKNADKQVSINRKYNTNFGSMSCEKPKNNTSGYKGVCWSKYHNKWQAYIQLHNKRVQLGYFDNIEDAVKARVDGEEKYFEPLLEEIGVIK